MSDLHLAKSTGSIRAGGKKSSLSGYAIVVDRSESLDSLCIRTELLREQPGCDVGDELRGSPAKPFVFVGSGHARTFLECVVQVRKELERDVWFSVERLFPA